MGSVLGLDVQSSTNEQNEGNRGCDWVQARGGTRCGCLGLKGSISRMPSGEGPYKREKTSSSR